MNYRMSCLAFSLLISSSAFAQSTPIEEQPKDPKASKIVLIAGSNFTKPGEHEYVGGCSLLMDLLRQTPGVSPVLALDWPTKPETLQNVKAVVFFFDGGSKHGVLQGDRATQVQKLADAGVGLVQFHQAVDYPIDFGDRVRGWMGAAWEAKHSQRAHWIAEFKTFPDHPICRGVKPFKIDDGFLTKLRFVADNKGIAPLLSTTNPKAKTAAAGSESVVAWAYERPQSGRSFGFTGGHLHVSFAEEGYRRFLTNGILWAAGIDIPATGAPVELDAKDLGRYLKKAPR